MTTAQNATLSRLGTGLYGSCIPLGMTFCLMISKLENGFTPNLNKGSGWTEIPLWRMQGEVKEGEVGVRIIGEGVN